MRNIIVLAAFFLLAGNSFAHPGKTDYHGGHKCWKGCNEWKLWYGEYHLHDEDWIPIRVSKGYRPVEPPSPGRTSDQELAVQTKTEDAPVDSVPQEKPVEKTAGELNQDVLVYEENTLPFNVMMLLALVLLLLICLICLRKRRKKD